MVITGVGVVSPLGLTADATWQAIRAGKSGVKKITQFDTSDCPVKIAAEVVEFDVNKTCAELFSVKDLRKVGRFSHFALAAALEAWKQSGLGNSKVDRSRIGVQIGVGMGGMPELEETHKDLLNKGYKRISPFFITQLIPNLASGIVSMGLGLKGPNLCITTACASSAHAIGESYLQIKNGIADCMIAGGAESVVCPLGIGGFAALRALSTRNDSPELASRPYDKDRDGFVMGEGSAILVLERLSSALDRGATILGEIVGYGVSADAYHFTLPSPDGVGGGIAIDQALKDRRNRSDGSRLRERARHLDSSGRSRRSGCDFETRRPHPLPREFDEKHDRASPRSGRRHRSVRLYGSAPNRLRSSDDEPRRSRCTLRGDRPELYAAHGRREKDDLRTFELIRVRRNERESHPKEMGITSATERRKLYIGGDHAAPTLKRALIGSLPSDLSGKFEFVDLGPATTDSVDYPDFAEKVGRAVLADANSLGILICGSGIGVSIAANRLHGVRAALCHSEEYARLGREHNAANVLCLGARFLGPEAALAILVTFLTTEPSTEDRHCRRVEKTEAIR